MNRLAAALASLRALLIAASAGSGIGHAQQLVNADDAAWSAAAATGTGAACQRYLEQFPAGRHAEEAFRCLIESSLEPALGPEQDLDIY